MVVQDDGHDWNLMPHRHLYVHSGHPNSGGVHDVDPQLLRGSQLRPHRQTEAISQLGGVSPAQVAYLLGCVDISPQPDESDGEMKEAKVSGVQLLKPGEDPAVMLYFVDEAFDQMTLPV